MNGNQLSHGASAVIHSSIPKISVVICTYNRCNKLKDTLVSLAQLSIPNDLPWELIVVDNNSSDETKSVVESFLPIPRLNAKYVLERNAGLSHARNRGVAESQGEVISFLDDDVIVTSDWLTEIWKAFQQYGAMCVGGRVLLYGNPQMPSWWHQTFNVAIGKFDRGDTVIRYKNADGELIGIGANMSFHRAVFEKYGLFDTEMGRIGKRHTTGEETDVVLRLGRNNELAIYYPRAVVYHCISNDRFSKRYLRLNAYNFGASRYVSESEVLSRGPTVLGVPLWMYRDMLAAAGMTFFLTLLRRRAEALVQERRMLGYLGYSAAAWRSRETVTGSANSLK
jgi:glycosyltransferase involved in cell wall biosynthesis